MVGGGGVLSECEPIRQKWKKQRRKGGGGTLLLQRRAEFCYTKSHHHSIQGERDKNTEIAGKRKEKLACVMGYKNGKRN